MFAQNTSYNRKGYTNRSQMRITCECGQEKIGGSAFCLLSSHRYKSRLRAMRATGGGSS